MRWVTAPCRALRQVHWPLALGSLLCLWASAPPGWFPGAGLLVLPGWMAFYAGVWGGDRDALGDRTRGLRRPYLQAFVVGTAHMLAFSFSVRHILLPAYLAIGVVGGLYYLLKVAWTRALLRFIPGSLAFGLALAGALWLRAHFTEIQYPHGQPVHCLYRWPGLLGSLTWGSEIFANLLIGVLAGGLVDLYRAWRVGRPSFRRSQMLLIGWGLLFFATSLPPGAVPAADRAVRIAALQPGFSADDFFAQRVPALMPARVFDETRRLAQAPRPPDLIVWPESVQAHAMMINPDGKSRIEWAPGTPGLGLGDATRLLVGTNLLDRVAGDSRSGITWDGMKVIALLTDAAGNYVGHHEKQRLVPGGERQPFLGLLPPAVSKWIRDGFEGAFNMPLPDVTPGARRPPLATESGIAFGAMVCYDNAFPGVIEQHVAAGASFLVVVSNEAWYQGGAELDQMVAMTVCRALECRVPIVRCTVDGASVVVGRDGRVTAALAVSGRNRTSTQILAVDLPVSARGHRTVPWLHPWVRWLVLLSALGLAIPLTRIGGRLMRSPASGDRVQSSDLARPAAGS